MARVGRRKPSLVYVHESKSLSRAHQQHPSYVHIYVKYGSRPSSSSRQSRARKQSVIWISNEALLFRAVFWLHTPPLKSLSLTSYRHMCVWMHVRWQPFASLWLPISAHKIVSHTHAFCVCCWVDERRKNLANHTPVSQKAWNGEFPFFSSAHLHITFTAQSIFLGYVNMIYTFCGNVEFLSYHKTLNSKISNFFQYSEFGTNICAFSS